MGDCPLHCKALSNTWLFMKFGWGGKECSGSFCCKIWFVKLGFRDVFWKLWLVEWLLIRMLSSDLKTGLGEPSKFLLISEFTEYEFWWFFSLSFCNSEPMLLKNIEMKKITTKQN